MAIQLVRRPGVGVDPTDAAASRAWVMEHVRQEVVLIGQPHPKIYLLGKDFLETFDVDAMRKQDPGAHLGCTFQLLRRLGNVERCFLVMGAEGTDAQGKDRYWAVVFEEREGTDGRLWWMAMLEYETDPKSGLGLPAAQWQQPPGETANPADLPPFVREIAAPPPGARSAETLPASALWQPDIRFAFGEVPEGKPLPTDAKQMVELAAALGSVRELLAGELQGSLVIRLQGRCWEKWVLCGEMPASLEEMIRWIANHRLPPADGVALVQIAVQPGDDPPVLGVQAIGEYGGMFVETWAPIEFPEGPAGPKHVPLVHWRAARPVAPEGQWLGVPSTAELLEPEAQ
jgi:hypothetical protein